MTAVLVNGGRMWQNMGLMERRETVAIVGVGLIGGAIGLALRKRGLAGRIVGVGRNETRLRMAFARKAVTEFTTDLVRGVAEADLIVVCTPVGDIVRFVQETSRACRAEALITDAGSCKGTICAALSGRLPGGGTFVGSHPMAGSEKSGVEFADADLYEGRLTIVTPTATTDEAATQRVEQFWQSLGSRVKRMTPEAHDQAVAAISHLPHLVASALSAATPAEYLELAASGWDDTTRVAAGDVELWRQILADNRVHVLQSLTNFEKVLSQFREALAGDTAELTRLLKVGKRNRDSLGN